MRSRLLSVIALVGVIVAPAAFAEPPADLADKLNAHSGQPLPIDSIDDSPVPGLYEVRLKGGNTLYSDGDGKYMIVGDLYQNADDGMINLTEQAANQRRQKLLAAVPEDQRVVYKPAGEVKAKLTVFTDTTCPYCHKLHAEMSQLNDMGIEVDYLAFPRMGPNSDAARQLARVWCADNRSEAMSAAFRGDTVDAPANCSAPIAKQYQLGVESGIQGTPAIVLPSGRMVPGYLPAKRLASMLGLGDDSNG
ncbi:DsbC family protein [Salinicola rhizosphaerae]|uniref:Thiol:disulfide interchange protein n=1 Tax=Salinicola rhizosphaerae TaxID=1443141 RepID=A0ABQ3DUL5_9GAMM|nr:DsbC family protein [Salinicola rhizosphaerae]GHB16948.1 thiol:disulfide interchange protein DsbC [Salinicola rhizosphaerae]